MDASALSNVKEKRMSQKHLAQVKMVPFAPGGIHGLTTTRTDVGRCFDADQTPHHYED